MPTTNSQLHLSPIRDAVKPTVSEWVDGYQYMANVCLRFNSARSAALCIPLRARPTYVDFRILEAFLQVVIYSLVRYFADECKI